ncbi:MAG: hypothetical protein ACFFBH_02370 [Promethearchaeota archaeon]
MNLTLSLFYFLPATGFLLSLIFLLLSTSIIGYILYYFSAFCTLSGFIFLIIFMLNLTNIKPYHSSKRQIIIILIYISIGLIILFLPGGITISESTDWSPIFSFPFFITMYIFFSSAIFVPSLILSLKLYKSFADKKLRKRFLYFFVGIIGMFIAFYGLILFNTWYNVIFRTIWAFLVFFIVVPSGIFIYYGIIHKL